jgi:O-antigen/teichoic acid export membrane protein
MRRYMRLFVSREVLRDGFRTLPGMLQFGLKITPGAVADGGSNESGTWIVASFSSIQATGAYGRAYLLAKALSGVNQFASEMLFPTLLERRAKGDGQGYARALVDSLRYTTIALLLVASAAGGVAEGIMRVFGPGFQRADTALVILLAYPVLVSLSQFQRFALLSVDRPWLGTISGLLRFGVTMGGAVLLTWKLGPYGAAIGLAIGLLADLAFSSRFVMRYLETPFRELWPLRHWLVLAVAYAGGFIAGRVTYHVLPWELGIVIGAATGSVAFAAVLWLGRAVNERDRERYKDLRRAIAKRRARAPAPIAVSPGS